MPKPPSPQPVVLRIELRDVAPLVWRRVVVANQWTLASLHHYLQWVMGWTDSHAHEFQVGELIVAPDWWIQETGLGPETRPCKDERRFSVAAAVAAAGVSGAFEYVYDMGDHWRHRIVIEPPPEAIPLEQLSLPTCLAGENACPPEDVGGTGGYEEFLEALADRTHEQHEDMLGWIGGVFDPKGFDLNRINREWRGRRTRRQ